MEAVKEQEKEKMSHLFIPPGIRICEWPDKTDSTECKNERL